ncbi:MAG: Crp/Fnr family transcriptional regulator [Hyphomicrobiaceae bacterium]
MVAAIHLKLSLAAQKRASYAGDVMGVPDLSLFPFLAGLQPASQLLLAERTRRISCPTSTHLVSRGDKVAGAYLVVRGALRVYYVSAEGREGTLYWVEPGQSCILALNCTFSRLAYPAWVESDGKTEISIIPGEVYRELFAREAAVQRFTFEALSGRLFELMALVEETASQGLEARIASFLLRRAKGGATVAITQEQLARHLATSREVVSRTLRRLAALGLVSAEPGLVHLVDHVRLVRLADWTA